MKKRNLIICNGEIPKNKKVKEILKNHKFIICADGGANQILPFKIAPNLIIGDLDSIYPKTKKYFSGIPQIRISDQDSTDLEKALNYLLEKKEKTATIIGATGKRIDHTIANFSIIYKYQKKGMELKILEEEFEIEIISKKKIFNSKPKQQISIIPIVKSKGIITSGLKYALKNETLSPGEREGVSNEAIGKKFIVSIKTGAVIIFIGK